MIRESRLHPRVLRRYVVALCLPLLLYAANAGAEDITAETLTAEHVVKAIDALVEEIYDRKHPERYWEPESWTQRVYGSPTQIGGYTVLAVMALLHAGESYQSPRLQEVIDHLKELPLNGTYAVSMRASLWARLPPRFAEYLKRDVEWLTDNFREETAGWDYDGSRLYANNSMRLFGTLALWDAAKRGITTPRSTWEAIEQSYLNMQIQDGGWNYEGDGPATGSMTAAGLAVLYIMQELLHAEESVSLNRNARTRSERGIERGLAWMHESFDPEQNPGQIRTNPRTRYFYYYLYAIERVGLASGTKYFGGRDWYREGAAELIHRLCEWDPETRTMSVHEHTWGHGGRAQLRIDDLAFGLMFLARGYVPPVMNKLQDHTTEWNNRPRDVANLTYWLAELTAHHLMWQIIDIEAPPKEWLDAPVLYYASHRSIPWVDRARVNVDRFVEDQRERKRQQARGERNMPVFGGPYEHLPQAREFHHLREYLDRGGMLLAVNEGSGRAFAQSVEDLGRILYPQYEWETAPNDHWAYTIHQEVTSQRPRLRVLSNGVRDLIVLVTDGDVSATLQSRDHRRRGHYHTLSNIYFYGSEMNRPRPRLDSIDADRFAFADVDPIEDERAVVVRAMYEGNWNPEPVSLVRFQKQLREHNDLGVTIRYAPLDAIHQTSPTPTLVHVAGTEPHEFTDEEQHAIRRYVEEGGLILFETPGGMGRFTLSAERMAAKVFGESVQPLNRHRIITGEGLPHATALEEVEYRPFSAHLIGTRETQPRLRGIHYAGQPRLIFSRDDLSHALLDQPCWGINGYSPHVARRMMRNLLIHQLDLQGQGR